MADIQILSGLGAKGPACIRLRVNNQVWLLDCGYGPEDHTPFEPEWLEGADKVFISHDHIDHIGGASHVIAKNIPIYCTKTTASALPPGGRVHDLPNAGEIEIDGVKLTLGRNGHALGGVWFHFDLGDGLFYSGDWSEESSWFAFDLPPKAKTALLDASYHLNTVPQTQHRQDLAGLTARLKGQLLFPVPPSGRAAELALFLSQFGTVSLDDACQTAVQTALTLDENEGVCSQGRRQARQLLAPFDPTARFLICDTPNADDGMAWELTQRFRDSGRLGEDAHLIFTGHMTVHAQNLKDEHSGHFCRWNVHPPLGDQINMLRRLDAKFYAPLFCAHIDAYAETSAIRAFPIGTEVVPI